MSLNVRNGAKRIDLVTLHQCSNASRQAHLFSMRSFGGAVKYSLFAMVFATRPTNLDLDPSNAGTGSQGNVNQKHPLGLTSRKPKDSENPLKR